MKPGLLPEERARRREEARQRSIARDRILYLLCCARNERKRIREAVREAARLQTRQTEPTNASKN